MTQGRFEKILLGAVFQQWVVHSVRSNLENIQIGSDFAKIYAFFENERRVKSTHLLIDLNGLLVFFQLSTVSAHFEQTFVCRTEGRDVIKTC